VIFFDKSGASASKGGNSNQKRGTSRCRHCRKDDSGFTLVELLIVTAIMPIIMGALAVSIVSIFKLQTNVTNRLTDSADSQQISSIFSSDITAAQYVTTDTATNPQCGAGTGNLLLSIDDNSDRLNGTLPIISYVLVAIPGTNPVTYDFERLYCQTKAVTSPTVSVLAQDVAANSQLSVNCAGTTGCVTDPSAGWLATSDVTDITYLVTEQSTGYSYSLAASPVNDITSAQQGAPVSLKAQTSCQTANANSGPLAANLCFIDFAQLASNPSLWAAATTGSGCASMSATVGLSDTLYFCVRITVASNGVNLSSLLTPTQCLADGTSTNGPPAPCVAPTGIPNYPQAFLGGCYPVGNCPNPFYGGIPGSAAIWLNAYNQGSNATATVSLTNIHMNDATGQAATGWQLASIDAESTDSNPEYITWSTPSATPLTPVCNGETWDNCTPTSGTPDYWGNACLETAPVVGLIQSNSGGVSEIQCQSVVGGEREANYDGSGQKTGAGMVAAVTPASISVTMGTSGGLQAITIGLIVSGLSG